MSTNKTEHYALHAWEPEDDFVRQEFNENFAKLDAALAGLQSSLGKKLEFVTGSYTGDGTSYRDITLGFRPRLVIIVTRYGLPFANYDIHAQVGGFFTYEMPSSCVSVGETGFSLRPVSTSGNHVNCTTSDINPFYYMAFK